MTQVSQSNSLFPEAGLGFRASGKNREPAPCLEPHLSRQEGLEEAVQELEETHD